MAETRPSWCPRCARKIVGTWDLRSNADYPKSIWRYCQYENTAMRLARPLPRTIKLCVSVAMQRRTSDPRGVSLNGTLTAAQRFAALPADLSD